MTTSATGLKPGPAKYAIHFAKNSDIDCMAFTGVLTLKKIGTDSSGSWSNVTVTIPSSAKQGDHPICGVEIYPIRGGTATIHDNFTVL